MADKDALIAELTPPTPWTAEEDMPTAWTLYDARGLSVATIHGETREEARATAELIVSTVNGAAKTEGSA